MIDQRSWDWADYFLRFATEMPPAHALWRSAEAKALAGLVFDPPVLDLGCGDGHFASLFFRESLAVGLDRAPKQVRQAAMRGTYRSAVVAEATALPFAVDTFSTVFSNCVLEHILPIETVLGEVARVLRPGGHFVFTVTSDRFGEYLFGSRWLARYHLPWCSQVLDSSVNRLFSHQHNDGVEVWRQRLKRASLTIYAVEHIVPPAAEGAWSLLLPISVVEATVSRVSGGLLLPWRRVSSPVWRRFVVPRLKKEGVSEGVSGGGLVVAARKDCA